MPDLCIARRPHLPDPPRHVEPIDANAPDLNVFGPTAPSSPPGSPTLNRSRPAARPLANASAYDLVRERGGGGGVDDRRARRIAGRCEACRPTPTSRFRESRRPDRESSRERLPCDRHYRARGVRQIDVADSVGAHRGSSHCLGLARSLRQRSCSSAHVARVSVRAGLGWPHRPDRRDWRPRCIGVGACGAAARVGISDECGTVRGHAGRLPRTAGAGLPRCPRRRDRRDTSRFAAGRGESV